MNKLKKYLTLALLSKSLASTLLFSLEFDPGLEKNYQEKIASQLLIQNYTEAVQVASEAVQRLPMSKKLREQYIETLSKAGDEKRLLQSWQMFARDFPRAKYEDAVLEPLAWGIIKKAHRSENLSTKFISLIAASIQNDKESVEALRKNLRDPHAILREMSLQFCLNFGDDVLKEDILHLLKTESVVEVRKKVIEVAQRLKIEEAKPIFEQLLESEETTYDEKNILVNALAQFYDHPRYEDVEKLSKSPLMANRFLAAVLIKESDQKEAKPLLLDLIQDENQLVQQISIANLGLIGAHQFDKNLISEKLIPLHQDPNPFLQLLSSWATLKYDPFLARDQLKNFLFHSDPNIRLQAAALIGYSLPHTKTLAIEWFSKHPDPYVRINLSFYLAAHRLETEKACDQIFEFLEKKESFHLKETFPVQTQTIYPTALIEESHASLGGRGPDATTHQLSELELLNLLATLKDARAKSLMSSFLDRHHFDVQALNLRSLLQFEEQQAFELMKEFLNHPDQHKRVESAIVLALFKKDQKALQVLEKEYGVVNRDLKQMILMAMGEVASSQSIPFLTDQMYQPSQSLRIQASAALIRCLRN